MGSRDIDIQCGFWSSAFGFCYGNALYVLIILISLSLLLYCICYRHWSSYIMHGRRKFFDWLFLSLGNCGFLTCCCDLDSLLLPLYFCVVSCVFLSKAFYVFLCCLMCLSFMCLRFARAEFSCLFYCNCIICAESLYFLLLNFFLIL